MAKPKIILVGKLPPPFIGPAIATQIILNSSIRKDFEVKHLDTTVNQSIDAFGKKGLRKVFRNLGIYTKLIGLLIRFKPDLVHIPISQTTMGFFKDSIFILICRIFNVNVLLQLRGGNFKNWMQSSSYLNRRYVKFCLATTKGMIVLGNNLKYLFREYFTENRIHVVPNGCNLDIPTKDSQSTDLPVQLLYFSNLLESKGIFEILEALSKLNDLNAYVLNAVGAWYDDNFKEKCLSYVKERKLKVTFHASCSGEAKWGFFQNADIFLFTPNRPEGHPWSIIEAMAARLPIISTAQGAIEESVLQNQNGYIVDSNSPNQIAKRLERLIFDTELRGQMGMKSQEIYQLKYTEKSMVENLTLAYFKTLNKNP